MQQLLHQVEPGLLDPQLDPIRQRIDRILKQAHPAGTDIDQRIRLITAAARSPGHHFLELADATLAKRPLHIRYRSRGRDRSIERDISPQRLTRYRDNWYLEAWCHLRENLRLFAIERIEPLGAAAVDFQAVSCERLDQTFDQSYGIFTGPARHTAILAFTPERARWIEQERWHPEQQGQWRTDGRYELRLPYSDPTELILDILRYGPDVEVIGPPELRRSVTERLREAIAIYQRGRDTD
jgi:predicted DNA-binding transcriptional regulator YafY